MANTPVKFVQTPAVALYSTITGAATSMIVAPYPVDLDGVKLTMSDFGLVAFATIDPKVNTIEEIVSFTSITDNGNNTATLGGLTRDLQSKYPYTGSGTGRQHGSSATIVFSDNPQVYASFPAKNNDETILGLWTFAQAPVMLSATPATATSLGNVRVSVAPSTVIGNPTISIASPAVFTVASHGLTANDSITLSTTGALPTGLLPATTYYVISTGLTSGAFEVSLTPGGTAVNTSGTQSGTHTVTRTTPIAVENEDPRLPTLAEAQALAAAPTTPSASNPYITRADAFSFGDGSDGAATLDGTATFSFLTKSGNTYTLQRDTFFTNLTINTGITLATDGWRVFVKGTLAGAGTVIHDVANPGGNGSGTTGGSGGAAQGTGPLKSVAGTNAGTGGSNSGGPNNGTAATATSAQTAVLGVAGQSGGNSASASGATGGTITAPYTIFGKYKTLVTLMVDLTSAAAYKFYIAQGQSGGGGGGTGGSGIAGGGGGGGGATGGIILIFANIYTGTLTFNVAGGAGGTPTSTSGGAGTDGGGGGGGNGGIVVIVYGSKTAVSTFVLSGGAAGPAGTHGNGGLAGGAGATGLSYEIAIFNLV